MSSLPSKYIALFALIIFFSSCQPKIESDPTKPNILFFFADDQRADALGCYGNPYISTPNLDALAGDGMRFTNSYIMGGHHGAICAPSRAMLMSGKSLFHVYDKLDGITTMPMYFSQYGYETFGTGKWHNGGKTFEAAFQKGDNVFLGGMSDHFQVPCRTLGEDGKLSEITKKPFSTDLFIDAAMSYLKGYAAGPKDNPFFCYVAFTAPHDPRSPEADYIGIYGDENMPLPGNYQPYHPFAFENMRIRDETLAPWPRTPEMIRKSIADYYGLITHIDDRVGKMINWLKENGLYENTIIVYAADNGLAVGSHGLLGKQNLYEHSMKVPLIMAGPGIPKDQLNDAFIYLFDLFPTLADLSYLPAPDSIDGENIVPLIKGETEAVRNSMFTAYRNTVRAVRADDWKVIRYPDRDHTQLFNLKSDPLEINDLGGKDEYQDKKTELLNLMAEWQQQVDDTAKLTADVIKPMEYDPMELAQTPDRHQPEYVLDRYFPNY